MLDQRFRSFRAWQAIAFLVVALFYIGIGVSPVIGQALFNLANVAAVKVLLTESDVYLPMAVTWHARAQLWSPDAKRVAPIVLASLHIADCYDGTEVILQEIAGAQQVGFALQGHCWWLEGKKDNAIQLWRQARIAPYLYHLAVYDQMVGHVDRSLDEYEALLAVDPASVGGWLGLGSLYEELENWPQAERAYEEAIRLAPENPLVHQVMAWYRWARALPSDRTEDELRIAIELASASPLDPHRTYSARRDRSGLYTQVRTARLDLPELYARLAGICVWTGRLAQSEEAARQAIALNPNLPWAYHFLGDALRLQGNDREAITAYRKALAIGETSIWVNYGLAKAYLGVGDMSNAMKEAQYLVAADPQELRFRTLLDEIGKFEGNLDSLLRR